MPSKKQILQSAVSTPEEWHRYLASLSLGQLTEVREKLLQLLDGYENVVNELLAAQAHLELHIKKREEEVEKSRRKKRKAQTNLSLRDFLTQQSLEADVPLRKLTLCTKTGATVLLEGLFFKVAGEEREVRNLNEAKDLFRRGHECSARWNLHYIREGCSSAGFAWDRPFLDEVFVLSVGDPTGRG